MTVEQVIVSILSEDDQLIHLLAAYHGKAAVFWRQAPEDTDAGWAAAACPRIVCTLDKRYDAEKKSSGMLKVQVQCGEQWAVSGEVEGAVRKCLKDAFLQPDMSLFRTLWYQTERGGNEGAAGGMGCTLYFDLMEYPEQETTDPDPAAALNRFIKFHLQEALMAGEDRSVSVFRAAAMEPVIYCRITGMERGMETNTVVWMNAVLSVHIFCPAIMHRIKYIAALTDQLSYEGEMLMLDHSLMRIKELKVRPDADAEREGQITVSVQYGLLRRQKLGYRIREAAVRVL